MFQYPFQPQYVPYGQFQPKPEIPSYQEVDGPESLQSIQLPPNTRAVWFQSGDMDRFYTVQTDAVGSKQIRAYDFAPARAQEAPEYLTRREFEEWRERHEHPVQEQQP